MKINLLLVDEELPSEGEEPAGRTPYMWYYCRAIAMDPGIQSTFIRTFGEAKSLIEGRDFDFNIVSLDVAMPFPGGAGSEMAKGGARTGLVLLDLLIKRGYKGPVLLLSNIPVQVLQKELNQNVHDLQVRILEKINTDPFIFLDIIHEMVTK